MTEPLPDGLATRVLDYLGVHRAQPGHAYLNHLLSAYVQRVPWESASRIARKAACERIGECPRWPETFWDEAMRLGTGGTCFESNLAFFALLRSLGFEGYLTVNNMRDSIGCHTASVVTLDDQAWLADVGYPVYTTLKIDPARETRAASPWMNYALRPAGPDEYVVTQSPHPKDYVFNLINRPVTDARYRAATLNDYAEQGLFLSRIILVRVIDGHPQRFDSSASPQVIETFVDGVKREEPLVGDPATTLSSRFGVHAHVLQEAFAALAERYGG